MAKQAQSLESGFVVLAVVTTVLICYCLAGVDAEVKLPTGTEVPNKHDRVQYKGGQGGSTYVRWGNSRCPQSSEMVYTGLIGGAHYRVSGGAANMLCLPLTPIFTSRIPLPMVGQAYLYGVEYEIAPYISHNKDGLCSVCRVPQGASVMIPATVQCPEGWSREYSGYLMAGMAIRGRASTEYICVDEGREGRENSSRNDQQGLLYFTAYACGSLPCPPFLAGKMVVCVVCSK